MKLLGYLLCFIPFLCLHAQEVEVSAIDAKKFTFNYSERLDETSIQRISSRVLTQCPELASINIQPDNCTLIFREGIPEEQQRKTILFCVTRFRYLSFKLKGK